MSDLLKKDYINSLPQLWANFGMSGTWPVYHIDVKTTLMQIDVCGRVQAKGVWEVRYFEDENGKQYDPETFYVEEGKND